MIETLKKSLIPERCYKNSSIFGFYIGQVIGKGAYSKVCVATRCGTNQKSACKIINKNNPVEEFINKFVARELAIIRMVKHRNIVKVYKIVEAPSKIYVFMEFCELGDILEYIKENGPFTEQKTKVLFKQILDAVHYLHNLGIAHRDIKCENIFLSNVNTAKLGDFGFARHCQTKSGKSILSDTFCGSVAYVPPEMLQKKQYDPKKCDVWALGCVLYIFFFAQMPFDDADTRRMVKDQLNRNVKHLDWCSHNLGDLLLRILEPDVHLRITTGQVMRHLWLYSVKCNDKMMNRPFVSLSDSHLI
ncbi:unnamed protein product [Diabrotica balteata]|uniref:Protein kinase domain-containing protein n=1 Tax=Diabrotica balteata TaxID=107213 RepID=A0A9N9STE6_DIABA|nr:unnamed protein product [Diabrotica balteata]